MAFVSYVAAVSLIVVGFVVGYGKLMQPVQAAAVSGPAAVATSTPSLGAAAVKSKTATRQTGPSPSKPRQHSSRKNPKAFAPAR